MSIFTVLFTDKIEIIHFFNLAILKILYNIVFLVASVGSLLRELVTEHNQNKVSSNHENLSTANTLPVDYIIIEVRDISQIIR